MGGNEHYDAEPARKRTRRFVFGLIASLVVVAALIFLAYRLLGAGGGDKVAIPDVAGQMVDQATKTLAEAGLVPKTVGEPSATVPRNHVIRTDPAAGEKLGKGHEIIVYFASEKPQAMPKVIGMTESGAKSALQNVGVDPSRIKVHTTYSDSCDAGKVVSSKPLPTSELSSKTVVTLSVCGGPSSIVPQIGAGTDVATAENVLRQAGYSTSQTSRYSSQVQSGRVIATDPSSGTRLAKGSNVTIIVSSGPAPTTESPTTQSPTTQEPTTAAPTAPPTTAPQSTAAPTTTAP